MRTQRENRAGGNSGWQMRYVSVSATMTYEERSPGNDAPAFEARSQDQQDRWLCERLRELYATGSFWHVSAKLAADRIETLIAERDCALAAFELELKRGILGETHKNPVVECERQSDGTFVPALVPSPELQPGAGAALDLPAPAPLAAEPAANLAVPEGSEITEDEVEAAARILCLHSGVDPDQPVLYREHKGVRVRSERQDEVAGRHSAMPAWKWRFETQARAALEAAAGARLSASGMASRPASTHHAGPGAQRLPG